MATERPRGRSRGRPLTRRTVCKLLGATTLAGAGPGEVLAGQDGDGGHGAGGDGAGGDGSDGQGDDGDGTGGTTTLPSFPPEEATVWGRPTSLGDGVIAAFVTLDQSGGPQYVGVWFTADALSGLPTGPEEHYETALDLPDAATESGTPFEWVGVDWNPMGHAPARVYDVPHFDFHFYVLERPQVVDEVRAGECDLDGDGSPDVQVPCDVYERGTEPVPDVQRPPGFVPTGDVVPHMGHHLVDEDAPEFRGEPFTHTMVWGSFDGRLTFAEPMVSKAFLESLDSTAVAPIPLPATAAVGGSYPTVYTVRYLADQDAYAVALERFEELREPTT